MAGRVPGGDAGARGLQAVPDELRIRVVGCQERRRAGQERPEEQERRRDRRLQRWRGLERSSPFA